MRQKLPWCIHRLGTTTLLSFFLKRIKELWWIAHCLDRKKNVVLLHFLQCYHVLLQKDKLPYQDMHGSGAVRTYQVIFPVHHALLPPLGVYFMPEMKCLRSGGTFPSHHQVINSKITQLPWKLVTIATMPWRCERHLNRLGQEHLIRFRPKCFQNY